MLRYNSKNDTIPVPGGIPNSKEAVVNIYNSLKKTWPTSIKWQEVKGHIGPMKAWFGVPKASNGHGEIVNLYGARITNTASFSHKDGSFTWFGTVSKGDIHYPLCFSLRRVRPKKGLGNYVIATPPGIKGVNATGLIDEKGNLVSKIAYMPDVHQLRLFFLNDDLTRVMFDAAPPRLACEVLSVYREKKQ